MYRYEPPKDFNHQVPLNTPMAFTDAMDLLGKRFLTSGSYENIVDILRKALSDLKKIDIEKRSVNFTDNTFGIENTEAEFVLDKGSLVMKLKYSTGKCDTDPSGEGAVHAQVSFLYVGKEFSILGAWHALMWYDQGDYETPVAMVTVDNGGLSLLPKAVDDADTTKDPAGDLLQGMTYLDHFLPPSDINPGEIRIIVEGRPAIGKTMLLARIARLIQKEIGLVNVIVEGVDDNPKAFQNKSNWSNERVLDVLLKTQGVRLIERYTPARIEKKPLNLSGINDGINFQVKTDMPIVTQPKQTVIFNWAMDLVEKALQCGPGQANESFIKRNPNGFSTNVPKDGYPVLSLALTVPCVDKASHEHVVNVSWDIALTDEEQASGHEPKTFGISYAVKEVPGLGPINNTQPWAWEFSKKGIMDIVVMFRTKAGLTSI